MSLRQAEVLVRVRRGEVVEAVHRGHAVVVEAAGRTLHDVGDRYHVTYMRSAAKPLQALPLVESGAADRLGLTPAELAVCCASHNGEAAHLDAVRGILAKAGVGPEALRCGVHPAWHGPVRDALARAGEKPGVLHNNCSGKHAGMLALAVDRGWPLEGYTAPDHPVQRTMVQAVTAVAGLPVDRLVLGIDGCTVPTFGLPLYNIALAFARLAAAGALAATPPPAAGPPSARAAVPPLSPARAAALARVADAMGSHPHLVAGTGRFCTDLGRVTGGRLIGKVGAEAVYGVAVRDRGWGVAVKVEDGGQRGLYPAVLRILDGLSLLLSEEREALVDHYHPAVRNNRGENVGRVEPDLPFGEA